MAESLFWIALTALILATVVTLWFLRKWRYILWPASASIVIGLLLGAAAVFGVTLMVQQDTKPPLSIDNGSSILNRVEYGDRS